MRKGKIVLIVLLAAIALCFTGILVWGITAGQDALARISGEVFL